ncbi:TRAM domain-containing protein, partial [bacterium]|nr:TRAM domain-containing protein [bacterium]
MHTEQSLTQPSDPSDVILTISGVSTDGRGIAKTDNRAVFLERCLPGDIVRGRLNWTTHPPSAQVIEYTTHSPDRVPHPCPHAADCPACPFGEWDYKQQLAAKTDLVRRTLSKQLGECEVREIIASPEPWHYRSRVSLRLE